jgi:threonine dehydrogenase-like Zn-dependent dehydrogenase
MSQGTPLEVVRVAAILQAHRIDFVDRPVFAPAPGELVLETSECGIDSGTDGSVYEGHRPAAIPRTIGHELAGRIVSVGAGVSGFSVGDYVTAWHPNHRRHGAASPKVTVEARNAFLIDPSMPFPSSSEPGACAWNAVNRVNPSEGDTVLVVGPGFMATLITLVVRLRNPKLVIAAGRNPVALGRAAQNWVDATIDVSSEPIEQGVRRIAGKLADVVFECTGAQAGLDMSWRAVREDGKVGIVGYHAGQSRAFPMEALNRAAIDFRNCHFRDRELILRGMQAWIDLVHRGAIDLSALTALTYKVRLADVGDVFRRIEARDPNFLKGVITSF